MMRKITKIIREQIKLQKLSYLQLKELEWAHVFHDSIRGKKPLENLPLNIGRWAGNYAFFYILNRVLNDFKPEHIIEFGLGESTKYIVTYLNNYLTNSSLKTIEHDLAWKKLFLKNFNVEGNVEIEILELTKNSVNGFETMGYLDIVNKVNKSFDLYIVDGPFGSKNFSRYDIVNLIDNVENNTEFIIIIDDYHRNGEKETVEALRQKLAFKNMEIHVQEYIGNKSVFVIATNKYKYITSL